MGEYGRLARAAEPSDIGRKHRPDYWLVILCLMMLVIGLIVVYAISPALSEAAGTSQTHYVTKQLVAIGLSAVAFVVMAKTPLHVIRGLYKPLLIVAAIATFIALITPLDPLYPAHRWVRIGGFSFQSVELLKFAILVAAAGFLAERARTGLLNDWQQTIRPLLIASVVLGLTVAGPSQLHAQSDLGSTAVILAMLTTMAFVAGMSLKRLLLGVGILAIGAVLVVLPSDYRRARVASFLHPDQGCEQAAGYQACQALIAVGSGGMVGLGLGRSVQAYGYLPEAANDSIFAIYAEKFGFIGVTVLLAVMAAFFSRLRTIAERAPDVFSRLIVVGVLAWLSIQAVINIGAMIGLLPLKGITLPFISYGGTSVVFAAAAVGLVFQISYYTALRAPLVSQNTGTYEDNNRGRRHDDSRDRRRQRGAYHPNPGSR
ncbi:MAG TPA: putative peptidoglycan glycosyltransferase FtsW [Candidatus Saccharimonadales bacterium]|jgi:cell division protein FtsW